MKNSMRRNHFRFIAPALPGALFTILVISGLFSSCNACRPGKEAGPRQQEQQVQSGTDEDGTAASLRQKPLQPLRQTERDSSQMLADDLESGAITLDEAGRSRILRLFRPDLVQEKYRYQRAPTSGTWDVLQASIRFSELSPETAAELIPYLVRPSDPRSIHYKRLYEQRTSLSTSLFSLAAPLHAETSDPVKEVYRTDTGYTIEVFADPPDAALARKARDLIAQHKMYERLEKLLGRKTLDFGDRTLSIYILAELGELSDDEGESFQPRGLCWPDSWRPESGFAPGTSSAWIQVSADQAGEDPDLAATLAHEMFHAFQFAFSLHEEKWLVEGSAVWAEDFIGPDWNTEQDRLEGETFRGSVHNRLQEKSGWSAYGMYLFFKYLTQARSGGNDAVMRLIWETCAASRGDTLPSVKSAAGGDFDDLFKEYSFYTMDEGEAKGKFRDSVGCCGGNSPLPLSDIHGFQGLWHIDEGGTIIARSGIQVRGTGISYYQVTNGARGTMAPTVRFDLSEFQGRRELGLQAVIEYRDLRTVKEDWSDLDERIFCLAMESQNFQAIYLAVSSTSTDPEPELLLLDLMPDSDRECLSGQVQIFFSEEGDENYRMTKKWGGERKERKLDKQWRHKIELTLDLVPQRHNTQADAARAAARLPGEIRARALAEMLRPEAGDFDENTNCNVYYFRVKAARINGFSRSISLSGYDLDADAQGVIMESNRQVNENWHKSDLSRTSRDDLKEESLRVRIYADRGTGTIKWINVDSVTIQAEGLMRRTANSRLRYRPDPDWERYDYRHRKDDQSDKLEEEFGFGEVSDFDKDLPMNPDWKARSSGRRTAEGGGLIEKPLDGKGRKDEGESWTRGGREKREFKWRLVLDVSPGD